MWSPNCHWFLRKGPHDNKVCLSLFPLLHSTLNEWPSKLGSSQHCQLLQIRTSLCFLFIPLFASSSCCLGWWLRVRIVWAQSQSQPLWKPLALPVPLKKRLQGCSCQILCKADLTSGSKKKKNKFKLYVNKKCVITPRKNMDATSRLTWLHMHATSSRWQIIAYSWAEGLDEGPLVSLRLRVNTCLFSPSNESLVDILGSVFIYLAAAVQQEEWLQSWLLCLFPLRPLWCDGVILRTYSGTERRCVWISHSSGLISFYWQGSRSLQWWVSGPPEGFSEGKPRPVCSDNKGLFEEQSQIIGCAHPSSSPAGLSPDSRSSFVLLFSLRTSGNYSVWNDLLKSIHVWSIQQIIIPVLILILSLVGLCSLCFFWPRLETVTLEECLLWEEHTVMCW